MTGPTPFTDSSCRLLVVKIVRGLVTGRVSVKQLGGPLMIAKVSVQAARSGFESLLALIALLSINIAILNLLPIPLLDGGQIIMNVAETVKGSAFSLRTRERIMQVGLVTVLLIVCVVTWNDVLRWLGIAARAEGPMSAPSGSCGTSLQPSIACPCSPTIVSTDCLADARSTESVGRKTRPTP